MTRRGARVRPTVRPGPLVALLLLVGGPWATAGAQTLETDRVLVSLDFGRQTLAETRLDRVAYELYAEPGQFETSYPVGPFNVLDVGGSFKLMRWLGAGVSVSYSRDQATGTIDALVPHPFFFDFHRETMATVNGLEHRELGVHLEGQVLIPLGRHTRLTVALGPTFFDASQDVVSGITTEEVGSPYDEVRIVSQSIDSVSVSDVGYNFSFDLAYFGLRGLWDAAAFDHVGLGLLVRYSRATPSLEIDGQLQPALQLGGLHVAGGLRLGF